MSNWYNNAGQPLSSIDWLEAHHAAKMPERTAFVHKIVELLPNRIVDLGCGSGAWLDLISKYLNTECELIGIDIDENVISSAICKSKKWKNKSDFMCFDIESCVQNIPEADIYLAFNVFPYLNDINGFIDILYRKITSGGFVIIRQYDGGFLRVGPMSSADRIAIDSSLHASVSGSRQFKHYDLDRVFEAINKSSFQSRSIEFELFARATPYPEEFIKYFSNTIDWTLQYISDEASNRLRNWYEKFELSNFSLPSYFAEVDLVAMLSCADTPYLHNKLN